MRGRRALKPSLREQLDRVLSTELLNVHLDAERARVMEYCFFRGVQSVFQECERIGIYQPGDAQAIGAYLERVRLEANAHCERNVQIIRVHGLKDEKQQRF